MTTHREFILQQGIDEPRVSALEERFFEEFRTLLEDHDITVDDPSVIEDAFPVMHQLIYEYGTSQKTNYDIDGWVEILNNELGDESGRNNLYVIAGEVLNQKPESEIGALCRQVYGSSIKRNHEQAD